MDIKDMDRLAAWLSRRSPKRLSYFGKLRWAGMPEKHLGPIAWALYRRQYRLEVLGPALVMAPPELLEDPGSSATPLSKNGTKAASLSLAVWLNSAANWLA